MHHKKKYNCLDLDTKNLIRFVVRNDSEIRNQTVTNIRVYSNIVICMRSGHMGEASANTAYRWRKYLRSLTPTISKIFTTETTISRSTSPQEQSLGRFFNVFGFTYLKLQQNFSRTCSFENDPHRNIFVSMLNELEVATHRACAATLQKRQEMCQLRETFLSWPLCICWSRIRRMLENGNFRVYPCGCWDSQAQKIVQIYKKAGHRIFDGTNKMKNASLKKGGRTLRFTK